jgi:hypothetical protein
VHASHSYPDALCLHLLAQVTRAVGDCEDAFILSRGYTEQQEWVWSLSSTLGREGVTSRMYIVRVEEKETRNERESVLAQMQLIS